jgi:hypothetical protein
MASFHMLHWIPDNRLHVLNGYQEVIDSLLWGLNALGHSVSTGVNCLNNGFRPIVFGAQLMTHGVLARLPPDAIIYNLEQLPGLRAAGRNLANFAEPLRTRILWDYSLENIAEWKALGLDHVRHVPIGYAPNLTRIVPVANQDIDVLVYGTPSETRMKAVTELCKLGLTTMFFYGLYGAARDALIARSKILLSVTFNDESAIFPIVRASYMFANRKAMVSDFAAIEEDIYPAAVFGARDVLPQVCAHLVRNHKQRRELEEQAFRIITRRDIRQILARALAMPPEDAVAREAA